MGDVKCVNAHDRCYGGAGGPCDYCEPVSCGEPNLDLISVLADAIHDRCFGIASLGDPKLALTEISDNGGIHEAVHQLLRALPARGDHHV